MTRIGQAPSSCAARMKTPPMTRARVGKAWIVSARVSSLVCELDRQDRLVNGLRGTRSGQGTPRPPSLGPVDDDDHVPAGLGGEALGRAGHVLFELDRVHAGLARLLDLQPDRCGLWIGVGGSRDGAQVGSNVVAEGHPDDHLPLVVGDVGVELRPAGSPATQLGASRSRSSGVTAPLDGHADGLEAQPLEREMIGRWRA